MPSRFLFLLACLLPLPAWAELTVSDAWVREAPPGAPALAAYLVLHNDTARPHTLTAVEARGFGRAMLHRTTTRAGIAHMEHVGVLSLGAGETLRMQPGGHHIMLMHPARPLREGDSVRIILHFADGRELPVNAPVRRHPPED